MKPLPAVVTYKDYKAYLRARIQASEHPRGMVSAYADAAGCQRSYFSQVINSHIQLTPDHAQGLVEYWNLPDLEANYFCLLVDHARAASIRLKNKINFKLEDIKKNVEDLGKRFEKQSVEPGEKELAYYSSWQYPAIHVITSIPSYQTAEKIADRLNLSVPHVNKILKVLERHEFVRRERNGWVLGTGDVHVPKQSHLNSVNHLNWRLQAVARSQDIDSTGVHYTSIVSMSHEDFEKLKSLLLTFIDQSRTIVAASPEQDLIGMTLDMFRI